jgi:ribosome-interacting GTPase 1
LPLPANLTAEAKAKWNKAQQAKTIKEKIPALQEFLSAIPKHKGNERLRAQTKRKIAVLKAEMQAKHKRGGGRVGERSLQKAGAAQIAVLGLTKAGRSSLLTAVTAAKPIVAEYPYATKESVPGMLRFEDVQFQIVELPALVPESEGRFVFQEGSSDLVRTCDGLIIMVDLSADPVEQLRVVLGELGRSQVTTQKSESNVTILKTRSEGIQLFAAGRLMGCTGGEISSLLKSYGVSNAIVRTTGELTLDDVEDVILENNLIYKPTIVLANKVDLIDSTANAGRLLESTGSKLPVLVISCLTRSGLSELGKQLFEALDIARVYTREPNATRPSPEPFIIKKGTTVGELSRQIHSALFRQFRYARVWGKSASYDGERVGIGHILFDGDIVQIHARRDFSCTQ